MRAPPWTSRVDDALTSAVRQIHLLASATPVNAEAERARLVACAQRGEISLPAWTYRAAPQTDVRARLASLIQALETLGEDPLAQIYLLRARELAIEAELVEAVATPRLSDLAKARFSADSPAIEKKAHQLATLWAQDKSPSDTATIACEGDGPDSLLSLMKKEVGKRALPFRVQAHAALSSLAATGDGVIYVAIGRSISKAAAMRTVLHEIEGHALPRVRAGHQELALFRIGTARGIDDQEGFALVLEDRHGFLVGQRRRDLAARALSVQAMRSGANFADVVTRLQADHDRSAQDAVAIAERIFRGSNGIFPGLGRESIYLQSFVRVQAAFAESTEAERVVGAGQVAIGAWKTLLPYITKADA